MVDVICNWDWHIPRNSPLYSVGLSSVLGTAGTGTVAVRMFSSAAAVCFSMVIQDCSQVLFSSARLHYWLVLHLGLLFGLVYIWAFHLGCAGFSSNFKIFAFHRDWRGSGQSSPPLQYVALFSLVALFLPYLLYFFKPLQFGPVFHYLLDVVLSCFFLYLPFLRVLIDILGDPSHHFPSLL